MSRKKIWFPPRTTIYQKFCSSIRYTHRNPKLQQQNRNPTCHGTYIHLFAYLQSTINNQKTKKKKKKKGKEKNNVTNGIRSLRQNIQHQYN